MARERRETLVLVPAYNEAAIIGHVLEEVRRHASDCDVLVVNDGSRDGTSEAVERARAGQLALRCNLAYGPALQVGFRYAARAGYGTVILRWERGYHVQRGRAVR